MSLGVPRGVGPNAWSWPPVTNCGTGDDPWLWQAIEYDEMDPDKYYRYKG